MYSFQQSWWAILGHVWPSNVYKPPYGACVCCVKNLNCKWNLRLVATSGTPKKETWIESTFYMAVYKYPGYEAGQGWTLEPGNLEGGILGGPISQYWGRSPQYSFISPPESPLKIPRFQCPPLACFIPWIFMHCHIHASCSQIVCAINNFADDQFGMPIVLWCDSLWVRSSNCSSASYYFWELHAFKQLEGIHLVKRFLSCVLSMCEWIIGQQSTCLCCDGISPTEKFLVFIT